MTLVEEARSDTAPVRKFLCTKSIYIVRQISLNIIGHCSRYSDFSQNPYSGCNPWPSSRRIPSLPFSASLR